ncbi:MAG: ribonuclease PH [Chloroflexota bacterium]
MRIDGRASDELRPVSIVLGYQTFAAGSALIEVGQTRVLCSVGVEDRVPPFLRNRGVGWVTAEYSMLPNSTMTRTPREVSRGRVSGRSQEIQRLIGRSLRAVTDMRLLGERTFTVDCDVLQADGGTRMAAVTGGYVALYQALRNLVKQGALKTMPLKCAVAGVSAGVVDGDHLLDLCYEEDSRADVDLNVVMTEKREFVEIQGTGETAPFPRETVNRLLALAETGIAELLRVQQGSLARLG